MFGATLESVKDVVIEVPTDVVNGPDAEVERYIAYVPKAIGVPLGPGGAVHVSTIDGMSEPIAVASTPTGAGKVHPVIDIPVIQLTADACCSERYVMEKIIRVMTSMEWRVNRSIFFKDLFT